MIERRKPIKRTALKRPTIEQVRAFSAKPRKAIAKVGPKAKRERAAMDHFREVLRARHRGTCEVLSTPTGVISRLTICGTVRAHDGVHPHHVWPEDHDRGVHDPAFGLWLCAAAHRWAHANPEDAKRAGLLRPHVRAVAS